MSEYLTYAAVEMTDLDRFIRRCVKSANKLGIKFEVPGAPTAEAHTWIGVFDNGWIFGLADPAVWELLDLFSSVARTENVSYLFGSTEGSFTKWSYEYAEGGEVQHRFYSDPSVRFKEDDYHLYEGDAADLARAFNVNRIRLQRMLVQGGSTTVQDFHEFLGFDVKSASSLKFVIVAPGDLAGPSTFSMVVKKRQEKAQETRTIGRTTRAFTEIEMAQAKGLSRAAAVQAATFGAEGDFAEAHDLFLRLRQAKNYDTALVLIDELIRRTQGGELDRLPTLKREIKTASIYGLYGQALYDLGREDEALEVLRTRAFDCNRYLGPEHRASIAARLGVLLLRKSRPREAVEPLLLCLAERPLQAETWAQLAQAAHQSGLRQEARNAVLQGYAADPSLPDWPGIMRDQGLSLSDMLPPRNPQLSKRFRRDAQEMMRTGDKMRAVAMFRLSHHHKPEDIDATWGLGCALAECLREGQMANDLDDHEVTRLLEQVALGNPGWPWSWGTLIEALESRGRHDRALQAADAFSKVHVQKLDDLLDVSNWLCGTTAARLGIHMLTVLIDRFVELRLRGFTPGDESREAFQFRAYASLGKALLKAGEPQRAIEHLLEASNLDPHNPSALADLGEAHFQLGNYHGARRAVSKGLHIAPDHPGLIAMSEKLHRQGV